MKTKLILLSYAIIIGFLFYFREVPFSGYENDGVYYMLAAQTGNYFHIPPPVYGGGMGMPAMIWLFNKAIPDTFAAAKLVSVLAGFLFLLSSMKISEKMFSSFDAAWTGVFVLLNPWFLIYSTTSLSDMLGAALPLAALWMLLQPASSKKIFFAGILLGLAWSVRSVNSVFWIFFAVLWKEEPSFRKKYFLAAAAGIILGMLPDGLPKMIYYHNPFYSENWRNLAANFMDWDNTFQYPSFSFFVKSYWQPLLIKTIRNLFLQIPGLVWHAVLLPLFPALVGLFAAPKEASRPCLLKLWYLSLLIYLSMIASLWQLEMRYFLPVLPAVFISGVLVWRFLVKNQRWMRAGLVVAVCLGALSTFKNVPLFLKINQHPDLKKAALFIKENAKPGETVLSKRPHILFYSGLNGEAVVGLPRDARENLSAYIASKQFSWVALENFQSPGLGEPVFKTPTVHVWRIKQSNA